MAGPHRLGLPQRPAGVVHDAGDDGRVPGGAAARPAVRPAPAAAHGGVVLGAAAVPRRRGAVAGGGRGARGLVATAGAGRQPCLDDRHLRAVPRGAGAAALRAQARDVERARGRLVCEGDGHGVHRPRQCARREAQAGPCGGTTARRGHLRRLPRRHAQQGRQRGPVQGRHPATRDRSRRAGGAGRDRGRGPRAAAVRFQRAPGRNRAAFRRSDRDHGHGAAGSQRAGAARARGSGGVAARASAAIGLAATTTGPAPPRACNRPRRTAGRSRGAGLAAATAGRCRRAHPPNG